MEQKQLINQYCKQFKTTGISVMLDNLITEAETDDMGYADFTLKLLKAETSHRHHNEVKRRLITARLPRNSNLSTTTSSLTMGS